MKPLADLFLQATAFDERNDHKYVEHRWPGAPYPCADYFTRGRVDENARTQKAREAVSAVVAAAEGFENCAQWREDEYISKLFLALKNLRDVLEGEK